MSFKPSGDWKDKIINSCECFTGGDNRFCLSKSSRTKECTGCELYDLKKLFFSSQKPSSAKLAICLMKLNVFTRKEIIAAIDELFPNTDSEHLYRKVQNILNNDPKYYYFITQQGIVKVYEKDKV